VGQIDGFSTVQENRDILHATAIIVKRVKRLDAENKHINALTNVNLLQRDPEVILQLQVIPGLHLKVVHNLQLLHTVLFQHQLNQQLKLRQRIS
jgi:hypothetical protein